MANLIQLNLDKETGKLVARGNVVDIDIGTEQPAFGLLFEQPFPSSQWDINHNLENDRVLVQIYDDTGEFTLPDEILIVDINNIQINLTAAMSGTAHMIFFSST